MGTLTSNIENFEESELYKQKKKEIMFELYLYGLGDEVWYKAYEDAEKCFNTIPDLTVLQDSRILRIFNRLVNEYHCRPEWALKSSIDYCKNFDDYFNERESTRYNFYSVKEIFEKLYGASHTFEHGRVGPINNIHIITVNSQHINWNEWDKKDSRVPVEFVHVESDGLGAICIYPDELNKILGSL